MVLSARRKGGSVAAKTDTSLPPDQELNPDQIAAIDRLTLEGLKLYERYLEDLNGLELQGRLFKADPDEEGDGAKPAPSNGEAL